MGRVCTTKRRFRRFTYRDRLKLEALYNSKISVRQIEKELGFDHSSLYRELKNGYYMHLNQDWTETKKYSAERAQQRSDFNCAGRAKDLKIGNDYETLYYIEELILKKKYSPEVVSFTLKKEKNIDLSYPTIYRYIDMGFFPHVTRKDLPFHGKRKKKRRSFSTYHPSKYGTSIEKRPEEVSERKSFGHWELDSVIGKKDSGNTLLVLTERLTRKELIFRSKDKTCRSTVNMLNKLENYLGRDFSKVFKTITCDNGVEFSGTELLEKSFRTKNFRTKFYYCHAYSSWERGSNEKQNQMIRRKIYKGTRIEHYSDDYIKDTEIWLNTYPRRMFDFETSQKLFEEELRKIGVKKIF